MGGCGRSGASEAFGPSTPSGTISDVSHARRRPSLKDPIEAAVSLSAKLAHFEMAQEGRSTFREGLKNLQDAADRGNAEAVGKLAMLYMDGQFVQRDVPRAVALYKAAARMGNGAAAYDLSLCYFLRIGVRRDSKRALVYERMAARLGFVDAFLALGWRYLNGVDVRRDLRTAKRWYERAAAAGDRRAAPYSLGYIAYLEKDFATAARWLEGPAALGHPRSSYLLGRMHLDGKGVRRDEAVAREHLEKAAAAGHAMAKRLLRSKRLSVVASASAKPHARATTP
jgi:uncharacterized protein